MRRRISRRGFIGGAAGAGALAAGSAAWAILAAREPETLPASPRGSAEPGPAPSPTATLPPPPAGGRQVITAPASFDLDTFDAQLTGKSAVVEILGRTHSRLVQWVDGEGAPGLRGDLATSWETPDATTVVFHLDPNAAWHNRPPLNGRSVTADDVVAHFRRTLDLAGWGSAPLAQRYQWYSKVEGVDSPGPGLVRFHLREPDEFLLDTLAGEFALVQAPEAVDAFSGLWSKLDSDHVIGSGPWTFEWADGGARFSASRGGHREAVLDELLVMEPVRGVEGFADGPLDEIITYDRRDAAAIRGRFSTEEGGPGEARDTKRTMALNRIAEFQRPARELVLSTFNVGAPPWNNPALITAISGTLNRHELAKRLFGGRASAAPPIPLVGAAGVITAERLKFVPGYAYLEGEYRPDPQTRQMWDAAGGPGLGTITVDFPSVFDPLYSASSVVIEMLNEALGPQFRPAIETYTTISERVIQGWYGGGRAAFWFGWGPPIASPSAERYVAEVYGALSPGQRVTRGYGYRGGDPVAITESAYFGVVPWLRQYAEVFRKPSAAGPAPSPFWQQHRDAERARL